jgi:flagellar hook-associated protein FlgK
MSSLSIGLSALDVNQRLLDITGQNVANASTAGYHRQVAELAERTSGLSIGSGVELTQVNRLIDNVLEQALNRSGSTSGNLTSQLRTMQQVENLLSPDSGSLNDLLQSFFDAADHLSTQPDDATLRQGLLGAGEGLSEAFNATSQELTSLKTDVNGSINQAVDTINTLAPRIADLNSQIERAILAGNQPNDLLDQRDQLISQVAGAVNVQTVDEGNGLVGVIAGGVPVVLGTKAFTLETANDPTTDSTVVRAAGTSTPMEIHDGQLAGLLQLRNVYLPDVRQRVDTLAHALIAAVDQIHATAIPPGGAFSLLAGQRAVRSPAAPLAVAGLAFPPHAGTLYVGVTNQSTGARTLTAVNIDPATQSLQDVATAISAVPNIQAVVDGTTNTLRILAGPGYTFDFAGRLPTVPQASTLSGTATAELGGTYNGTANDRFTYKVVGTGTVGVTAGLALEVRNNAGQLLGTYNIGQGYAPGSALTTANGVTVKLTTGTVNDGDTFAADVVATADTAGILPALGVNTFFQGQDAGSIGVRPDLAANPTQLALSRTGDPGDGGALVQLAALRDAPLVGGQQSLQQAFATLTGNTGTAVSDLTTRQQAQDAITQRLQAQQQTVSGVDSNEELVKMLQFQRAFQVASRYVSVVNTTYDALVQIL